MFELPVRQRVLVQLDENGVPYAEHLPEPRLRVLAPHAAGWGWYLKACFRRPERERSHVQRAGSGLSGHSRRRQPGGAHPYRAQNWPAVRRSQQRRIASQKNPDGSGYAVRRRKVYRTQQGIKFFWNNEVRALKNWRGGRGKYGRTITGYDEKRRDIRTFYRADIERYLEIKTQSATHSETKSTDVYPPAHPAFYEAQAGRGRRHRRI